MHPGTLPIGVLVGVGVYLLIAWGGFRWARALVNRQARKIASELERAGVRVLAQRPTTAIWRSAEIDIEANDQKAKVSVRQWGRDSQLISVAIDGQPMPAIWMRRERGIDRMAKALGFEREVQLGVPEVDADLFIASTASDDVVREALANAETQRLVRDIVGQRYIVVTSRSGLRASTFKYLFWQFDTSIIPSILERLRKLAATLPKMSESVTGDVRVPLPTIFVIVPALASIFVPIVLLASGLRDSIHPPIENSAVLFAMLAGAVAWFPAVYLASRWLRTRPFALLELMVVAFALLAVVPLTVASGLMFVNAHFDHSAAVHHHVQVVDYYRHNSHTVYVAPWDASGARQKVIVPGAIASVQIGDTFDIDSHAGALGWTWVSDIRRVP